MIIEIALGIVLGYILIRLLPLIGLLIVIAIAFGALAAILFVGVSLFQNREFWIVAISSSAPCDHF